MINDRIPPEAIQTEAIVLSSILVTGVLIEQAKDTLSPEVFYKTNYKMLYLGLLGMYEKNIPIDLVSAGVALPECLDTIQELCSIAPALNIEFYIKVLNDKALRRKIIKDISVVEKMAYDNDVEIVDTLDSIESLNIETERAFNNAGIEIKLQAKIITPESLYKETKNYKDFGETSQVFDTGFENLREFYRPALGTLNVYTGMPSSGKSEYQDAIMMNLARMYDWKWLIYSPENYPYRYHMQKLIEKYTARPMYSLSETEFMEAMAFIDRHFKMIDAGDTPLTPDKVFKIIREYSLMHELQGVVIDPWNSLEIQAKGRDNKTDAIGAALNAAKLLATRRNLCLNIVAHPTKMYKNEKTGKYPVPTMYDVEGSAHWYNMAFYGFSVYRYFKLDVIEVHIQKVKFKHHGKIGVIYLQYNRSNGCFTEYTGNPEAIEAMM
jgi:replicative DNA helicase